MPKKTAKRAAKPAAAINLYEAKTRLSALVERAAKGEEIVIAKAGKPMARLVALPTQRPIRVPGGWKGQVWIAPDFDDPLPADFLSTAGADFPPR